MIVSKKTFILISIIIVISFLMSSLISPKPVFAGNCWVDAEFRPVSLYCPAAESNYRKADRGTEEIDFIVIHTVQGSLGSAVNTFQSGQLDYPRSAHFTVGKDGSLIQSVKVKDIAWHAGTSPLGSGGRFESRVLNANSIGIEHGGYVDEPQFPTERQLLTSAALTRLLCSKYGIPIDREHIVGHEEIKPTKGDPGPNWDWDKFMDLVKHGRRPDRKLAGKGVSGGGGILPWLMMIGGGLLSVLALSLYE